MKPVISSFAVDTIFRVAFGVKVNSLKDPNNPIIQRSSQIFSNDLSAQKILPLALAMMFPRLGKLFDIRFCKESVDYLYEISMNIIKQKRQELLDKGSSSNESKASNFVELLLEAEQEIQELDTNKNKSTKCNYIKGNFFCLQN